MLPAPEKVVGEIKQENGVLPSYVSRQQAGIPLFRFDAICFLRQVVVGVFIFQWSALAAISQTRPCHWPLLANVAVSEYANMHLRLA